MVEKRLKARLEDQEGTLRGYDGAQLTARPLSLKTAKDLGV